MFASLVRFAGHTCAVVTTTAMILVASVHAANRDRPFEAVKSYGTSFAQRMVDTFDAAVMAPIANYLPRSRTTIAPATFDEAFAELEFVVPSIQRVIVEPGGSAALSGVATPGVEIVIQARGRALGQTKVSPTGHWQLRLERALAHGDHHLRAVAHAPGTGHRHPGQEIRIALPQTLTKSLVVLGNVDTTLLKLDTTAHQGEELTESRWRMIQAGERDERADDRDRRRNQNGDDDSFAAPLFDWLRRSSIAYDRWIVDDLSGGDDGFRYVIRGRDRELDDGDGRSNRARRGRDDAVRDQTDRQFAQRNRLGDLGERWQTLSVRVREWLLQAQQSYRDNIVVELSRGERVSRDRFSRATPNEHQPRRDTRRETRSEFADDWSDWQPEKVPPRTADSTPKTADRDWPVVRDDHFEWPEFADVKPDPEKEALIRKAQRDAEKARELARKAAAQAEATRTATEELLAEEKKLEADWAARRDAAKRAETEAELKRRTEDAEKRAADAEAKVKDAERLAKDRAAQDQEARERAEAQRKTAEDLAAAATAEADKEFAAGNVREPPVPQDPDTKVAEAARGEKPAAQEFIVADTGTGRRLSIKDSASDGVIEEGSTFGDVDDFDPSVRYVYDMGDGAPPKAKRKKRRHLKKYRAKSRKAKRKRKYRKHARKRRAYRSRSYRKRRARVRRRARLRRVSRRIYRQARRFGRLYKFKARRRTHYRRHAYARAIFIPRIRWRRR